MDPRQAQIERNAHFTRGPRFFREDDEVMFEFVIDATNTVGPRPARVDDVRKQGEAFKKFCRENGRCSPEEMAAMGFVSAPGTGGPAEYRRHADREGLVIEPSSKSEHPQGQPTGELPKRRKPRDAAA